MKKKQILIIGLIILVCVCGLKEFTNAALTRNALTEITQAFQSKKEFSEIFGAVLLLALSLCIFPVFDRLYSLMSVKLRHYYRRKSSEDILTKYGKMKFSYFDNTKTYDLCSRTMKNAEEKMCNYDFAVLDLIKNLVSAISLVILIINIAWWTLPFCLFTLLPMVLVNLKKAKDMHKAEEERALFNRKAEYASSLLLHKEGMKEAKVFRSMPFIRNIWNENFIESMKRKKSISFHAGKQGGIVNMIYAWAGFPVVLVILWLVTQGKITFADYMVLSNCLSVLGLVFVYGIAGKIGSIKESRLFYKDYKKIMNFDDESTTVKRIDGEFEELCFSHVSFTYPNTDYKVLSDVSFCLKKGEKVALVGVNGAGKSTIIKLLLGLYKPDDGCITINHIPVGDIDSSERSRFISAVFQDYTKYEMSLRENIAFGNMSKLNDDNALLQAASKGMILEKITSLPKGLDTKMGVHFEDGENLSEGQWQKLCIARLFFAEAGILILDEPTQSLDPRAESELYEEFLTLSKEKSCIMISHRLGSTKICDRILVLSDGKIIEHGTHKELMNKKGEYAKMFTSQSSWYLENQRGEVC